MLFDIIVHFGTLVAVVIVFYQDIISLLLELLYLPGNIMGRRKIAAAWRERANFRMLVLIFFGSIPTGLIGVGFKDYFERLFHSPLAVGLALIGTGLALYMTRPAGTGGRSIKGFRIMDALAIGLAQGLAITPGVSRSGLTISVGVMLGLNREMAARYSFLLSIPAIVGALILQLGDPRGNTIGLPALGAGFLTALLSGLVALKILLSLVRKGRLHYFAYYCWLIGLIVIGLNIWRA